MAKKKTKSPTYGITTISLSDFEKAVAKIPGWKDAELEVKGNVITATKEVEGVQYVLTITQMNRFFVTQGYAGEFKTKVKHTPELGTKNQPSKDIKEVATNLEKGYEQSQNQEEK